MFLNAVVLAASFLLLLIAGCISENESRHHRGHRLHHHGTRSHQHHPRSYSLRPRKTRHHRSAKRWSRNTGFTENRENWYHHGDDLRAPLTRAAAVPPQTPDLEAPPPVCEKSESSVMCHSSPSASSGDACEPTLERHVSWTLVKDLSPEDLVAKVKAAEEKLKGTESTISRCSSLKDPYDNLCTLQAWVGYVQEHVDKMNLAQPEKHESMFALLKENIVKFEAQDESFTKLPHFRRTLIKMIDVTSKWAEEKCKKLDRPGGPKHAVIPEEEVNSQFHELKKMFGREAEKTAEQFWLTAENSKRMTASATVFMAGLEFSLAMADANEAIRVFLPTVMLALMKFLLSVISYPLFQPNVLKWTRNIVALIRCGGTPKQDPSPEHTCGAEEEAIYEKIFDEEDREAFRKRLHYSCSFSVSVPAKDLTKFLVETFLPSLLELSREEVGRKFLDKISEHLQGKTEEDPGDVPERFLNKLKESQYVFIVSVLNALPTLALLAWRNKNPPAWTLSPYFRVAVYVLQFFLDFLASGSTISNCVRSPYHTCVMPTQETRSIADEDLKQALNDVQTSKGTWETAIDRSKKKLEELQKSITESKIKFVVFEKEICSL